ncbi:hypothetical protein [Kutzneria sp. 744]|uniref:hypothetical protein n=1 Tax=Kutzneria sp. (strain 744) TaxID=345341 RepID=UPI001E344CBC|nr:hypothetical protein [Kutzneria sp. 744]
MLPDWVVVRATVPEYSVLPVPAASSIPLYEYSTLPLAASVNTCCWIGVWSARTPVTTVS